MEFTDLVFHESRQLVVSIPQGVGMSRPNRGRTAAIPGKTADKRSQNGKK